MGNTRSEIFEPVSVDLWWNNDRTNKTERLVQTNQQQTKRKANEDKITEAKRAISSLHEKRLKLIAEKKKEMNGLREEVAQSKKENDELRELLKRNGIEPPIQKCENDFSKVDVGQQTETFEVPGISNDADLKEKVAELELQLSKAETIKQTNLDLLSNIAELKKELQQRTNSEVAAFENERQEYKTHVIALKDIITVSKQLLLMRESQIKELSQKVEEIQATLAETELKVFSEDLRKEYERQLQNIKQLRALYEERQRTAKTEKDNLTTQLDEAQADLKSQETKNSELQARVDELEKDSSDKYDTIIGLESQLGLTKAECGELRAEMSVINQLFSQILLGFNNGREVDLDKLIKTLEENHDLLTDIVINEESNELSAALPKVLLDLVSQVNDKARVSRSNSQEDPSVNQTKALTTIVEESESQTSSQQNSLSSASEIVQNLPKVWKVLTELLSHQSAPVSVLNEPNEQSDDVNPCYKSVETPTGSTMVLSVSKTFIRLKNLILEKKSLEKETTRLKQLNTHLETRLQDQEKRLGAVSDELSKTWNVVGKMQKQHQQLHTQEKILRYELAQKRKLLNELKEELEYCREKWLQAREKNSSTEEQWKQLRNEFAARKNTISEDLNNSVESGYSDERESSSSDDEDVVKSEIAPECSGVTGNPEGEAETIPEIIGMVVEEIERGDVDPLNVEQSNPTILEVIKDEIAKIEGNIEASGETSSSSQQPGDVVQTCEVESANALAVQELNNSTDGILVHPQLGEVTEEVPTSSVVHEIFVGNQTEAEASTSQEENPPELKPEVQDLVLNGDKSTEEANSKETLKTDLVQNQEVQKDITQTTRTPEEMLAAREERLKRLEEQAKDLVAQTTNTSNRSVEICTKLEDLHEQYGNDPNSRRRDIDDMYKKLEEDILRTIKKTQGGEEYPSTSKQSKSTEEILAARDERLKRLEEESNQLVNQAARTSHRSTEMSSKLDSLHQQYTASPRSTENEEKGLEEPGTSSERTPEEILAQREERLQKMEEQAQQLVKKARKNSLRRFQLCRKLNKLHERYGESSDSSDEGADDNNNNNSNNNAGGVQEGGETQSEDISLNNEERLDLGNGEEETGREGEREEQH